MIGTLQLGSLVHILDKTKGIKYLVGEVIDRTEPVVDYNATHIGTNNPTFIDVTVKVNDEEYQLKHLNTALSVINNGNLIISDSRDALNPTVENTLHNSKKMVDPDNIKYHEQLIVDCEEILTKLNPSFAKEKETDKRISELEQGYKNVDNKLEQLIELIKTK